MVHKLCAYAFYSNKVIAGKMCILIIPIKIPIPGNTISLKYFKSSFKNCKANCQILILRPRDGLEIKQIRQYRWKTRINVKIHFIALFL